MCLYRYVYYSRCQHPELIRVSYCDRAKSLGHSQRDDRCLRGAVADNPPDRRPSHLSHYPTHRHLATQHQDMSTSTPSDAVIVRAWADAPQSLPPPDADVVPPSAHTGSLLDTHGYNNVNIDIPLDTQSSLSMELTHDGKAMELVARFASSARPQDSDASQAHRHHRPRAHTSSTIRPDESDSETVRASPAHEKELTSPHSDTATYSPRKPIPSPWKPPTQPRAPVFHTDIRKEERERRKSIQGTPPAPKALRGARSSLYLTKDAAEAVDNDITSTSSPPSPKKLQHRHSKANLQGPVGSPTRSSPRQMGTIKINISPTRNTRPNVQDHEEAPSVSSNQGSEYHSAHSPVSLAPSQGLSRRSSRDTFYTADERDQSPPALSLTGADGVVQAADARKLPTSQLVSHMRSKTESQIQVPTVVGQKKLFRPAVPKLPLRIPPQSTNRGSQFTSGSASSSASGSPTKSLSRIPRITSPLDGGTKAPPLKRTDSIKSLTASKPNGNVRSSSAQTKEDIQPQRTALPNTPVAVPLLRHVRTLNSAGNTPIISRDVQTQTEQPDLNDMVTSYLNDVDPDARPDHTPFTEEAKIDIGDDSATVISRPSHSSTHVNSSVQSISEVSSNEHSSRKPSTSTVDTIKPNDPVLNDPAIVYTGKKIYAHGTLSVGSTPGDATSDPDTHSEAVQSSDGFPNENHNISGRGDQNVPQNRRQSAHSLRSKGSSDLRATAPEFFPQSQDGMFSRSTAVLDPYKPSTQVQASDQNAVPALWMQPVNYSLAYDPFGIDNYGLPWFFHMYPVHPKSYFKSPKKGKTFPRGRKRADTSLSPKKFTRPSMTNEEPPQAFDETPQDPAKAAAAPFSSQLDEIAHNMAAHREKDASSPTRRGYTTLPPRSGRPLRNIGNGLYNNTFGRGHFRPAGMPIEATVPFPDPIPPAAHKQYIGYSIEPTTQGCGIVDIERAAEWVGGTCNKCEPDH